MSAGGLLTTSPMLFGYRGADGRLAFCDARNGERFRLSDRRAAEIAEAFLEPRAPAAGEDGDFTPAEIEQAREAGILVEAGQAEEDGSLGRWEHNGWSRAAYLLFSQMDLEYAEFDGGRGDPHAMVEERRRVVSDLEPDDAPPERPLLVDGGREVPLPAIEVRPSLAALTSRRSHRAYSPAAPSAEQLAGVLSFATSSIRLAREYRSDPDPFRMLNSYLSWAHLYVLVQSVEDVEPGVYEYDPPAHRLVEAAPAPPDEDVLPCAQGQRWILGPGFAVFVVADLRRYAWLYRTSRSYIHVLEQAGELGQEMLTAATELGLAGWTTPALQESRTASLLGLPEDDAVDVISVVKLGLPRNRGSDR